MFSLRKIGCGRAALRSSSSNSSRAFRRSVLGSRQTTTESRPGQLFSMSISMAKPPGGVGGAPWKEAPFSALAMGQHGQQGAARSGVLGKRTAAVSVWEAVRLAMTKQRRVPFLNTHTNLSNQCGHMSFLILALAYLETDVLALRGYAASGIGLSILFQFYRPQPLWIPIGWNGLFLLINASMIGLLLREKSEAANIGDDPEQAKTFEEVFERVELSPMDFVRLMDVAERRVVPKGSCLSREGRVQEEVFLIVEGAAQVEADGDAVGHLEHNQFVGSMAFNRFIQASPSPASTAPPSEAHTAAVAAAAATAATADPPNVNADVTAVTADSDGSGSNSLTVAADGNKNSGEVSRSVPALGGDKESNDGNEKEYDDNGDDMYAVDDMYVIEDGAYVPGGGGVFEEAREVALNVLRRDSIVGNIAMAQSFVLDAEDHRRGGGAGKMERSGTTVTATTEMVVYAWDMHLLRAFIKRRSLAGAAFMKAISADLIRKVDQSRGAEERYRLLLAEALDGGVITPIEKKKLHRYRDMHGISPKEHEELLKEHEWREEEFEAGFQKGVAPRDGSEHFLAYEALVRRELAKGEVQEKGRQKLRKFRAKAGIDAQEHLLALEKQGWTADDYELGGKGKAAGLQVAENSAKSDDMNINVNVSMSIIDDDATSGAEIKSNSNSSGSSSSSSSSSTVFEVETTAAEAEPTIPVEVDATAVGGGDGAEEATTAQAETTATKTKTENGVERTATANATAAARKGVVDSPATGAEQRTLRKPSASTSASAPTGAEAAPELSAQAHA